MSVPPICSRPSGGRALVGVAVLLVTTVTCAQTYQVGHEQRTFIDAARGNRAVLTEIYYPANSPGDGVPVAGAPGTAHPVIVFGHAILLTWDTYQYLWDELVPLGYIMALPRTEGGLIPSVGNFAGDLGFLITTMRAEGANPASLFFGRVGAEVAAMGHSMGGGAGVLAAEVDPSITTVIGLAAANLIPSAATAAANVNAPSLIVSGSSDCHAPAALHQIPIYNALASPCKALVTITDANHCQFAGPDLGCDISEVGCLLPSISRSQQQAIILSLVTPWTEFMLKGDAAAWSQYQAVLAAGAGITVQEDCTITICGDCNLDLAVNIVDSLNAAQHAVGLITLAGQAYDNCDVDSSTQVTVLDALPIAQKSAGLPVTLTCP